MTKREQIDKPGFQYDPGELIFTGNSPSVTVTASNFYYLMGPSDFEMTIKAQIIWPPLWPFRVWLFKRLMRFVIRRTLGFRGKVDVEHVIDDFSRED